MRIRAFVGERVTEAQTRLASEIDAPTEAAVQSLLMRCMFTDQVFIRKLEHATLDPTRIAALVHADRMLSELSEQLSTVSIAELPERLAEIDRQFDDREAPAPAA